jgi:hypothetical protein
VTLKTWTFAALVCLFVGASSGYGQQGLQAHMPKSRQQGLDAIRAMGARLPEIAKNHSLSTEDLAAILRSDRSAWLDSRGRLFYVEQALPEALAHADAVPVGVAVEALTELETFQLHSRPAATKVIYLDFEGEYVVSPYWNGGNPIDAQPYDVDSVPGFSAHELERIQGIWQRVAEDFAPFDVDVTTEEPHASDLVNSGAGDSHWGIHVLITPTSDWYGFGGGVAYYGSFSWGSDTPCWVFSSMLGNGSERYVAEVASHEIGHTLKLSHDGLLVDGQAYYGGHGTGDVGWAPIMGVGYYRELVQWSKGEYPNANNTQDDLAVIVASNGFGYRVDDHGDDPHTATPIELSRNEVAGVIEGRLDVDVFRLSSGAGVVTIDVQGDSASGNLDLGVELRDGEGVLIASSSPVEELSASLSVSVVGGSYTLHVTGVGNANSSDYSSLGQYRISGSTAPFDSVGPTASASSNATEGSAPIEIGFSSAGSFGDQPIVAYAWAFGDGSSSSEANPSYLYSSPGTYAATLSVADAMGLRDSATVVITVTPGTVSSASGGGSSSGGGGGCQLGSSSTSAGLETVAGVLSLLGVLVRSHASTLDARVRKCLPPS